MKYLLLPFFLLRLSLNVFLFLTKIFWANFNWSISLLLSICVVIFQLLFFLDQALSIRQNLYQAALETFYKNQYQQRLVNLEIEWLELLAKQPTDRDVLINLSLIDGELGKTNQEKAFKQQALQVDPNFQQ
jgi:hypothetical protein